MIRIAACMVALAFFPFVGVLGKPTLGYPLRQLRFSPDGRHILAQDTSRVTVLTVQPFGVLFQAPAASAGPAKFSPDSREIVFLTPGAAGRRLPSHVERWSIADRARVGFIAVPDQACQSEGLSPDGRVLACVDAKGTLRLLDVASGGTIFLKKRFARLFVEGSESCTPVDTLSEDAVNIQGESGSTEYCISAAGDPGSARFDFSPDGRFLIVKPQYARGSAIAFDLPAGRTVRLAGRLKDLNRADFTFVAPDRMVISRVHTSPSLSLWNSAVKSVQINALVAFPSGEAVSKLAQFPPGTLSPAADSSFVRILAADGTGRAIEYRAGQVIASATRALDVSANYCVTQGSNANLGLFSRSKCLQAAAPRSAAAQPKTAADFVLQSDTSRLEGQWIDPQSQNIASVGIRKVGGTLRLHAFGRCHPQDCDWGEVALKPYVPFAGQKDTVEAVSAEFRQGSKSTLLVVYPGDRDRLSIEIFTAFTGSSGSLPYHSEQMLRRSAAARPETAADLGEPLEQAVPLLPPAQPETAAGLAQPVQLSPPSGSVFSVYPSATTLRWSAVPGAAGYGVEVDCYDCCQRDQWCSEAGGDVRSAVVDGLTYVFYVAGQQRSRWRVWAIGPHGEAGPKTDWCDFRYTR